MRLAPFVEKPLAPPPLANVFSLKRICALKLMTPWSRKLP
jgi:hypothetical protein